MSDKIKLYGSTIYANITRKKEQERIEMVLEGKGIEFEKIDITLEEGAKQKMKEICGENALPPQLCKGDIYLGDCAKFDEAIENEELNAFLKI